jgi:23S rRNA (cytidine1920-2'-O)/16S rRNA (cytidine1409-2'-O)-methyltransferase
MAAKTRLDMALVERGLAETRATAQRLVMAGLVFSSDKRLDKAGYGVAPDMPLEVRGQPHPYVSRDGNGEVTQRLLELQPARRIPMCHGAG